MPVAAEDSSSTLSCASQQVGVSQPRLAALYVQTVFCTQSYRLTAPGFWQVLRLSHR